MSRGAHARMEELRVRLEGIAEELADLSLDSLGRAADGDEAGLEDEKRFSRCRRAVVRAIAALDGGRSGVGREFDDGELA